MKKQVSKGVFAFPYLIISLIFVILPLMLVFVYAFRDSDGNFTFTNFIKVFTNSSNYLLLLKTIGISALATLITLLLAYPVALILASSRFNKKVILALLFILPMWMNFVLRIFALKELLSLIGISYGFFAALVGLVYDFFPFMLLPIYTVLVNLDKSYIEAGQDLGAGVVKTFIKVILPLSIPGVMSGVTMVFMPCFSAYAITEMMGDSTVSVIGGKIDDLFNSSIEWGLASALSFVLLVLVFLTMFIADVVSKQIAKRTESGKGDSK